MTLFQKNWGGYCTVNKDINLKRLLEIIKSRLLIIIAIMVVVVAAVGVYTKLTVTPAYASVIKFCLVSDIHTASTSGANERNAYMYANELMGTCIETLETGDAFSEMNGFLQKMKPEYSNIKLRSGHVNIKQTNEKSNIFNVTIVTIDPQLSYDACYAFETMATERATKVGKLTLERVDSPILATAPVSSGIMRNCAIALIMSFIVSTIFFVVLNVMDNTVKDGAALCEEMGMLLLAEIPDVNSASNKEKIYKADVNPKKGGNKR